MNKYAAEKTAQEYYALGAQLALTKQANLAKGFYKAQNALLGATSGGLTAALAKPHISDLLAKSKMLSGALEKSNLKSLLSAQQQNLAELNSQGVDKMLVLGGDSFTREGTEAAIKKLTSQLSELGPMTSTEEYIGMLPEALGIGAGLGVGTGIYKGLGKLDKKLKLY